MLQRFSFTPRAIPRLHTYITRTRAKWYHKICFARFACTFRELSPRYERDSRRRKRADVTKKRNAYASPFLSLIHLDSRSGLNRPFAAAFRKFSDQRGRARADREKYLPPLPPFYLDVSGEISLAIPANRLCGTISPLIIRRRRDTRLSSIALNIAGKSLV